MTSTKDIELRSISVGKWANLFMAFTGIGAAIVANTDALMLDGLFSGVNFIVAIIAARVALSVSRPPDNTRPFGYEIDEVVYIMFRALILLGIILVALFNALDKISTYAFGGVVAPIKLGWIMAYVAAMVAICTGLAIWHHVNWRKSGKTSKLLETERSAAIIDGAMSAGAGIAFLGIDYLRDTALAFLVPISDSIVIIVLSAAMLPQPLRLFRHAVREVLGVGVDDTVLKALRSNVAATLAETPFTLLDIGAARVGRGLFFLAYLQPDERVDGSMTDEIRDRIHDACLEIHKPLRIEVVVTRQKPFLDHGIPA